MKEANPETLLIYKELVETIHAICDEMSDPLVWVLRMLYYDDNYARESFIDWGCYDVDYYRGRALSAIRDGLAKAGIIEKKKRRLKKREPVINRYVLNRSEFYEPN